MQRKRNGFLHFNAVDFLEQPRNLGQVQVRWASKSSTQPSRQCFLKWFMIIRNRLCIWHVFMFSASRFHTSHGNRLCAEGPTAPVCVPLGLRTCPVSCKVSAPSRHDHGLVKCSSRGPGSQWDVPAGDGAWARTNSWPCGLQGPSLHSQAVRSLAHPPAFPKHGALLLPLHTSIIITERKWKGGIWARMRLRNREQLRNRVCCEIDCLDTVTKVLLGQMDPVNKTVHF